MLERQLKSNPFVAMVAPALFDETVRTLGRDGRRGDFPVRDREGLKGQNVS